MRSQLFYPICTSASCRYAAEVLKHSGIPVIDHASPEVTHLLLDIPCALASSSLEELLNRLPDSTVVIGGRIPLKPSDPHAVIDLLADEEYLIHNAAITAECALEVLLNNIAFTAAHSRILILGWGRIAKPLLHQLLSLRADVSVASRSKLHLSEAEIFGAHPVTPDELPGVVTHMDVIINTAPAVVIPERVSALSSAVKIDLASSPGIEGTDVIHAVGLPGKLAPISSGKLIAQSILRKLEAAS